MNITKHAPPVPPPPTFTLEVTEHEADLIRFAVDLAGSPSRRVPQLTAEQISEMDLLYIDVNHAVGYREASLKRLGFPA